MRPLRWQHDHAMRNLTVAAQLQFFVKPQIRTNTMSGQETEFPAFRLGESRFDQNTFYGRWKHFRDITDPLLLFTSKAELERSCSLLEQFKNGTLTSEVTDRELWQAQKIKQAIIHPDTGEKIFMPFRMSGFVPFGSPIVVGLLLPNQTFVQTAFWQWINQSHNACVNYANRNASKVEEPTPMSRFVLGYVGAVSTAVSIALGLGVLIKRANRFSPAMKMVIQKFVPFPAVAFASTTNVILMRNSELTTGIDVFDKNNQVLGASKAAAKKALTETAQTRMFLPAPILLIPPVVMTLLERTKFLIKRPYMHLPCNAVVTTLSFAFALPVAIALFPQVSQIKREELEPELQQKTDEPVLMYNKGL